MRLYKALTAMRELLANPANWTQETLARDANGLHVAPENPNATCFCLSGALLKVAPITEFTYVISALCRETGSTLSIPTFNDMHTHSEVLALIAKALKTTERNSHD